MLQGNNTAAGAAGAASAELAASAIMATLYPEKTVSQLSEEEKQTVSSLATISAGMAGGIAGDSTSGAATGAVAGKNAVENNALSLVARGCAIAAPCRAKVAEQLLDIDAKAGIAGLAGAAIKDVADKMTSDELDHLVMLEMMGNDEITGKYLSSLQDKYAPSHTDGNQIVESGSTSTGGNQTATGNVPIHTGNNQASGQGTTNTGNTKGKPDTGGNTTVTSIPDGPNKDDLAYLDKPANLSPEGSGRAGAFNEAKRQSGIPVSQSPSNVYPNIDKRKNPQPGYI